ncbi:extensin family protein [Hoeflea ulvae]|uniref:Extensin family protein n=1 Tax=Hoeflea ulvae TaxID=2983764 RepID=A0ABT3YJZ9_9HYPH|nr:extensin family protein [Hoeflea ulvae]MCY0096244.1 extensin family protein [Hoeflea ulvae]
MRRLLVLPAVLALGMGLDLPEDGPVPPEKPRQQQPADGTIPVPAPNPAGEKTESEDQVEPAAAGENTSSSDPEPQPAPQPGITAPEPDEAALVECEAELRKLGAVFDRIDPVSGENGCGIDAPYSIEQVIAGVTLSPASQLRCDTALALAKWTSRVLVPATSALPGDVALTTINHGSAYVCRRRNNLATGKMSEHSIGNAIDIVSFGFKGRDPVAVSPRAGSGTMEEAYQRAVRGGACLYFTTVLGPGTNDSHANHLHLDIIERTRGYRLCE